VLTGLGMCVKKDLEIEEKMIYDMILGLVLDISISEEVEETMRNRKIIHWSRD
jgi:hypothetical protein